MENLSNVRALLVKLQAVFELPQKLRYAREQGAIELAADKYDEVSELLRIYGHKVSLSQHKWRSASCKFFEAGVDACLGFFPHLY